MKHKDHPTGAQWDSLSLIARNVEFIVSDSHPRALLARGLLSGFDREEEAEIPLSRLAASLALPAAEYGPYGVWEQPGIKSTQLRLCDEILSALPGADNLGSNRQERIARLTQRMPELPAYEWLCGTDYVDAVQAIRRAGRRNGGKFASDVAEFDLLALLIFPLSMFLLTLEHPSTRAQPQRRELDKALARAKWLKDFFSSNTGMVLTGKLESRPVLGLHDIVSALQGLQRGGYKGPPDDLNAMRIHYLDSLIVAMQQAFGACSAPVLMGLAGIVDYRPESSNLYARIKKLTADR